MRTADAVSPIAPGEVSTSLIAYLIIYAVIFTAGVIYILRLMAAGPSAEDLPPDRTPRAPGTPLAAAPKEP